MGKLTILQINIIGAVTALVLAIILFFALIRPKNQQTDSLISQAKSVESSGGTQDQVDEHTHKLKTTQVEAKNTERKWQVNAARYMPALPFKNSDKPDNLISIYEDRGFKDLPTVWGKWVTAWYDGQRRDGVTRLPGTQFPIPAFPSDPNAISTIKDMTLPDKGKPWQVAMECKSFGAAMRHLERFNTDFTGHGMPVVNNVSLDGQSPALRLTYDVILYIIPGSAPPAADPRLGGTTTGAAMGAAGAGMSGGYPGMMGGMPGMPGGMHGMPGGPSTGGPPAGGRTGGRGGMAGD